LHPTPTNPFHYTPATGFFSYCRPRTSQVSITVFFYLQHHTPFLEVHLDPFESYVCDSCPPVGLKCPRGFGRFPVPCGISTFSSSMRSFFCSVSIYVLRACSEPSIPLGNSPFPPFQFTRAQTVRIPRRHTPPHGGFRAGDYLLSPPFFPFLINTSQGTGLLVSHNEGSFLLTSWTKKKGPPPWFPPPPVDRGMTFPLEELSSLVFCFCRSPRRTFFLPAFPYLFPPRLKLFVTLPFF